jgi:hypothetical protein
VYRYFQTAVTATITWADSNGEAVKTYTNSNTVIAVSIHHAFLYTIID